MSLLKKLIYIFLVVENNSTLLLDELENFKESS